MERNQGGGVFETPAGEYKKMLERRKFDCQISLEDVFNEAVSTSSRPHHTTQAKPSPPPQVIRPTTTQWTNHSYYRDLGLEANCSQWEITAAYRRLASIHHPDKGGSPSNFHRIQSAYDALKDPSKRQHYDEFGPTAPFLS